MTTAIDMGEVAAFGHRLLLAQEAPAMLAALRKFIDHPLPYCETDEERLARLDEFMQIVRCDSREIVARIYGTSNQPELAQDNMGREFTCRACGREEGECSAEPCAAVIADREASDEVFLRDVTPEWLLGKEA